MNFETAPQSPPDIQSPPDVPSPLAVGGRSLGEDPADGLALPPRPGLAEDLPGLGHTVFFFVLAIAVLLIGELVTIGIGRKLPAFRHEDLTSMAGDARLMIPAQALQYAVLLALTAGIFGALWQRPFWKAIHWNFAPVARRWFLFVGAGVLLAAASSLAGNYLPMPKEAPILNDLMHSSSGAWLMLVFGTTGAPVVEELAFRGFLLPSLVNFSRRVGRRRPLSSGNRISIGTIASVLLTSLLFAVLHSLQVSYAWAPMLLIGLVSVVLCSLRLWSNSLAASTLVHATYNLCLFAGMLIASDGFRHLEKLNN